MSKRIKNDSEGIQSVFLFGKKNYIFMGIGLAVILLGFLLMSGGEANTRPDGVLDPNYWNEDVFSWRRIRLAPFIVLVGFGIEVYAILLNPDKKKS